MRMELDFLSMATVMMRVRLSSAMVVALMVLNKAGEDMEVCEVVKLGGISSTVAYRTLSYLESKGLVRHSQRKDFYRRRVSVWGLTARGRELVGSLGQLYKRVEQEWARRWRVQKGGRL